MAIPTLIDFLSRNTPTVSPRDIVLFNAADWKSKINPSTGDITNGYGTSVLITPEKGLQVQVFKNMWMVMAAGIILDDVSYITTVVTCLEYVMTFRNNSIVNGTPYTGATGSFPAQANGNRNKQDRFHNKNMAMHSASLLISLFRGSSYNVPGTLKDRVDVLVTQLAEYTAWMSDDSPGSNINQFFDRQPNPTNANQLVGVACFLREAGRIYSDAALSAQGIYRFEQIFANNVSEDGVYYEALYKDGVGFDGNYQRFSMWNLSTNCMEEPASDFLDLLVEKLALGTTRLLATVDVPTGFISTQIPNVWTRVRETYPSIPGLTAKGWNWDDFVAGILASNAVVGDTVVPDVLSDKIAGFGKSFGKEDGDLPTAQLFIVMTAAEIAAVEGLSIEVDWAALGRVDRVGGGACPSYPGGTLPDPVSILPDSVLYQAVHAEHYAYLSALPLIDINAPGFPPEP
jgi:hypothetical protein